MTSQFFFFNSARYRRGGEEADEESSVINVHKKQEPVINVGTMWWTLGSGVLQWFSGHFLVCTWSLFGMNVVTLNITYHMLNFASSEFKKKLFHGQPWTSLHLSVVMHNAEVYSISDISLLLLLKCYDSLVRCGTLDLIPWQGWVRSNVSFPPCQLLCRLVCACHPPTHPPTPHSCIWCGPKFVQLLKIPSPSVMKS